MKITYKIERCDNGLCVHSTKENGEGSSQVIEFGEDYDNVLVELGRELFGNLKAFLDSEMVNEAVVTVGYQTNKIEAKNNLEEKQKPITFGAPDL